MRFSEYFNLDKKQNELDFVDIPIDTDIALFIDPFVLAKREDELSIEASQVVSSFFQEVITLIRSGDDAVAQRMLAKLNEPNATHFGLSTEKPKGRGVGGKQSIDLFSSLKASRAVQTGFINDIQDCELVIPGIGHDKISDVVTNLMKILLIGYTREQCELHGIPVRRVASGSFWNAVDREWDDTYVDLPIVNHDDEETKVILVPKAIARYDLEFNHTKYYNGFVLEFLQRLHIRQNSGLVHILKNQSRKVYKKDLSSRPEYKLTKEFLYSFSNENPQVLQDYKQHLDTKEVRPIRDEAIEKRQHQPQHINAADLIEKLRNVPPGNAAASQYHDLIKGILTCVFYPNLINPKKEEEIHDGRKRIDISFSNAATSGFFFEVSNHAPCIKVFFECKNYSKEIANPELDQIAGRFSPRRGKLGFVICRSLQDKELFVQRCRDTADDDRGFILILDDSDIITLLGMKSMSQETEINDFLRQKLDRLIL